MGIWGKKVDTWVSDKLGQSRTTSRISARLLGAGLAVALIVVAALVWVFALNDVDPWADVCKPAVDAQLPAGDISGYDVGSLEVTDFADGTQQVTGYIAANDETFQFECQTDGDMNVTNVVVNPQ